MINVDLKRLLKGGVSRYSLCVAVAKLSREINDEMLREAAAQRKEKDREPVSFEEKPVSIAVEKILNGEYEIVESDAIKKF